MLEKALIIIFENKVSLVQKKSDFQKTQEKNSTKIKTIKFLRKAMIRSGCIYVKWVVLNYFPEKREIAIAKRIEAGKDVMLMH